MTKFLFTKNVQINFFATQNPLAWVHEHCFDNVPDQVQKFFVNPITYGILRFRQLGGRGRTFWPMHRKQNYGDLKLAISSNGEHNTGKHAKFQAVDFLFLEI